jgi:hypothetical protein
VKALERATTQDILRLGPELARTESSGVFATDKPGIAAKIWRYADGARARKLAAMIAAPPEDPGAALGLATIAWPVELLRDGGRTIGYAMPEIAGSVSLAFACDPAKRLAALPGFNWHYLHVAALGVARSVAALHARGYVVGDLRPSSFVVDRHARVAFVGCDGIQVRDRKTGAVYRALAPFDERAAPELQGRDPAETDRAEAHDRHALAVLLHEVLLDCAQDATGGPGFGALHPELETLFARAFGDGIAAPRLRPSAADWIPALRAAIEDLVPCARELGHFHASRGPCVWCERVAASGKDVFATPSELAVETDFIVAHVERALLAGDDRHALKLWSRRAAATGAPPEWDARMAALARTLAALDAFAAHYATDSEDDAGLARLWRGPPDLSVCNAAHREGVGGETYAAIGARIAAGLAALDRLRRLEADVAGDGLLTEAGEMAIAEAFDAARRLVSARTLAEHPTAARADEAQRRLARFAEIRIALEIGDDARAVEAWGDGRLFARYAPARERHVDIMRTIYRANALVAFERHYARNPDDDSGLWALWMREPTLAASRLARQPSAALGGRTPLAWAEIAERRITILQGIMQALIRTPPDTRRIADLWDEKLCRGRQAFRTLEIAIDRALAQHDGLTRLLAAVAADADGAIVEAWSETVHAARPEIGPYRARIREAFRRALAHAAAPAAASLGAFEKGANHVAVRWLWPNGVEACAVILRGGRAPTGWDDVERPAHRQFVRRRGAEGQAGLPCRCDDPVVAIWPATWIAGAPVLGPAPLLLSKPRRIALAYRFESARSIALDVPAGTAIPALVALGARGRIPIPGDRDALLLGRIGALASEAGGRLTLALDPAGETDLYVRLYPEDPSALAAYSFRHPPFRESRIDPG